MQRSQITTAWCVGWLLVVAASFAADPPEPAGRGWGWIAGAWGFMGEQRWTFVGVFLLMAILYI